MGNIKVFSFRRRRTRITQHAAWLASFPRRHWAELRVTAQFQSTHCSMLLDVGLESLQCHGDKYGMIQDILNTIISCSP